MQANPVVDAWDDRRISRRAASHRQSNHKYFPMLTWRIVNRIVSPSSIQPGRRQLEDIQAVTGRDVLVEPLYTTNSRVAKSNANCSKKTLEALPRDSQ
jgi:hypothetical protein